MSLLTAPAVDISKLDVQKKRSFIGIQVSKSNTSTTRQVSEDIPAVLVARNISTASGGNTVLKGTVFETSLGGAQIAVGVGPNARADAQIILEGAKKTVTESVTKENNYVVWQRQTGAGSTVETMVLPKFTGPVAPTFSGPVLAQIPAGEFKTQIQTLSQQPGMEYLNTLAARTDVKWEPVKLAYDQWSYKQEGLTPAGAALVAVAVTIASGGTGAGASASLGGQMMNAAYLSLQAQAAITLVNNKGNIGKTLNDMAKMDTVKAALTAAITAGVLNQIGATATMQELANKGIPEKLTFNLINASGRALTNAAINGGSLEDALRGALVGGLVDTAHGAVASEIGLANYDYVTHKLAHALSGCLAGAAAQGTCRDGAIGSAVGEIVAGMFKGQTPAWTASDAEWNAFDAKIKGYGKLVAGAVAAYAGGNAQTAITTAEVAIDNNSRLAYRVQAMQQGVSPQQFWINMRVQSLQIAVRESGGSVPGSATVPGARVNYSANDISQLEGQLRGLSPQHQLIYSPPSATLSPLPYSYVNMRTAVNMDNVPGANSTNAFGFPSGNIAYFRALMSQQPQMFSTANQTRITRDKLAPVVDAQWVQYNPAHQNFQGETLAHHHLMQGGTAVAIPASIHLQWSRVFHPFP